MEGRSSGVKVERLRQNTRKPCFRVSYRVSQSFSEQEYLRVGRTKSRKMIVGRESK